jgi:hypothetical protein
MTARDGASSVQGVLMRVRPLNVDGTFDTSKPVHWTSGFISASFAPELTTGDEIETKAADGSVCVSWKADDSLKRLTFNLALCNVDPEVVKLLAGGSIIVDGSADAIGYSSAPVGSAIGNPVCIEIWSYRNVGGKPGTPPYYHWVFPYVKVRYDGEREFSNTALANQFTGQALGNAALTTVGLTGTFDSRKETVPGTPDPETNSYRKVGGYATALANPFSYVAADLVNIPAMVDDVGDPCATCVGSWSATTWAVGETITIGV